MSIDFLTFAEQDYFEHIPAYKQSILEILKSRGLPLRLASIDNEPASITTFVGLMNKIKGGVKGRGKKTVKWRFVRRRK